MTRTPHTIEDMPPYLLRWAQDSEGHEDGLKTHCGLILTNAEIPSVFSCSPGSDAVLVTLRHVVQMKWNSMTALSNTCGLGLTLITCPAFDTVQGLQLKLGEKFALEIKPKRGGRNKQHEHDPRKGTRTGYGGDGHVWRLYGPGRGM